MLEKILYRKIIKLWLDYGLRVIIIVRGGK